MNSRLQPNRYPQHLSQLALKGLLAVTMGLMTVACSKDVANSPETAPSNDTVVATAETSPAADSNTPDVVEAASQTPSASTRNAEVGNDGEPDEPLTADIERLNLEPGTPYGEVRSLVMVAGWVPYTQADGATPDPNSRTVQELHAQGFEEAETCSGTGQGFCAFLFTHMNQVAFPDARLKIITTPSMGELYGEPNFYGWDMWAYEPVVSSVPKGDSPNYEYLEANATYETQKFNAALYAEVLAQEQDCVLIGDCANSQYLFEDVLLTFSTGEFGSTTMAVVPHALVSRTQALNYAQMLDLDGEIDFADSIMVSNYEGGELPPEGVRMTESFFTLTPPAAEDASTKMVRLIARPNEDIFRVEFEFVML
ncbi:MAG: hypothetical protein F6K00_16740 [Leptolyngbya sp. SIOISBB]|nr:hypothetical protein [Leptolyngbya sp. SIOISBB]